MTTRTLQTRKAVTEPEDRLKFKADQRQFNRDTNQAPQIEKQISEDEPGVVTFPLSSEEPYQRYYWEFGYLDEILDHSKGAVDLEFLNSGNAPLIDSHRWYGGLSNQIGVIRKAWLQDKRIYVEVKFSQRAEAQAVYEDVKAGIIRNVSVGYEISEYNIDEKAGTYTATRWRPREASFVTIPADETVGIGRSGNQPKGTTMENDVLTLPGIGADQRTADERAEAMTNAINEITALASEHNIGDIARSYIAGQISQGQEPSLAVFKGIAVANLPEGTPLVNNDIGLTEDERQSFSVMRLMRSMMSGDTDSAGFEREAVAAAEEKLERSLSHGGFVLPTDLMGSWGRFRTEDGRLVTAHSAARAALATGGNPNILTTDHLAESFIDNLRNVSAVVGAGATMLEGLSSDVEIPGGDQNIAAAWLASEDADAAESNPTFRKITLAPKDLAAFTDVTRRMLQQQTIDLELYIRAQMVEAVRLAIDTASLYGSGAAGIPEGIANTTGIGSVTFASAIPTRDEIIDMKTAIASTNQMGGYRYLGNSAMVGDLQKTKVDAGSGIFLMNDDANRLVGHAFSETNQITDGDLFVGNWSDLLIGMWDGLQLDMSTEAKFLSGGRRFRVIQTVDTAVRRVGSFTLGNDTP
jgi:HK97 family phage major capsid protein/HK97 family phage prohead protease